MSVLRWVITDPYLTTSYTLPRNPLSMSSPYPAKAVTSYTTTTGSLLLTEGASTAQPWTFTGPLLDKDNLTDLLSWTYGHKRRLVIRDHFGRDITCYLTGLEVIPKRRTGYYYSHDYTMSALVISVSAPTVANAGPL